MLKVLIAMKILASTIAFKLIHASLGLYSNQIGVNFVVKYPGDVLGFTVRAGVRFY